MLTHTNNKIIEIMNSPSFDNAHSSPASTGASSRTLFTSPAKIWRSKLSWRIALSLFLTIFAMHALILGLTLRDYEQSQLRQLAESNRIVVAALIDSVPTDSKASPFTEDDVRRMLSSTPISGLVAYDSSRQNIVAKFGSPVLTTLSDSLSVPKNYYSRNGNFYEAILKPQNIGWPYYIVVQMDSSNVKGIVRDELQQSALLMILTCLMVTVVLMYALSRWLLEPILFMRDSLIRASQNPEEPEMTPSPFDPADEIGGAIALAQGLILQNAENIRNVKSTAEDQIHKLAYYDTLTGLPNRVLFLQTLNDQIRKTAVGQNSRFAVIAMDIDHFKDVNDSMGHTIGDAVLRAIGRRLRTSLPESATIARIGEDEFAITMPLTSGAMTSEEIAQMVIGIIRSEPFKVFDEIFQMRASIGVSTYPTDGVDPDQVLKNADIALNRAKNEGRDMIKEYSADFDRALQLRFQLLRDLREAMEKEDLSVYFQPQFDLQTGRVIGAEALLRWWKADKSKEGGRFISPADFVPIAEQSGLIVPIGELVLRKSCHAAAHWNRAGHNIRIAVNVSGAQFYQSDIIETVTKILEETGLPPQMLEMEVTESVFMEDVNHAITTLQRLHRLGVELAIDDFGTGYSSLSYLRQFPIDRLKIDQSFIRNALENPDDAPIARTIIHLGHSLNLKVIAEGVETIEHENFLREEGCDEVQGFRYSRPLPLDKLLEFIDGYKGNLHVFK